MRVKLHKGPMHGKTYEIRDGERDIVMSTARANPIDWFKQPVDPMSSVPMTITTVRYEMLMIRHPKYGYYPATDPDGRVFFKYVG